MLSELGFLTEDEQKTHGDLPIIVEAVRVELDQHLATVATRASARFAPAERRVIIGDEMGLEDGRSAARCMYSKG